MKTRPWSVAALACITACKPPAAAAPAPEAAARDWPAPPIAALLGERERLSLTSAQVAALDSIFHEWGVENDRLNPAGTIVQSNPFGGASMYRGRVPPRGPKASANNLRAAQAVEQVLDERQREAVCALHLAPADRRRRSTQVWPWCAGRPGG
jgi:hypothetical protein